MNNLKRQFLLIATGICSLVISSQAALVAHYTFDEGAGATTAFNSVSGAANGVIGTNITTGVAGISGNAYSFTGTTAALADCVDMGNASFLSALTNSGQLIFSAWVKTTDTTDNRNTVVFAGLDTSTQSYTDLGVAAGQAGHLGEATARNRPNLTGAGSSADQATGIYSTGMPVNDGFWHNIVMTVSLPFSQLDLYVDGALVNTHTMLSASFPIFDTFEIGRLGRSSPTNSFAGCIDDVQVYDTALSAGDVQYLFNNPGSVVSPPAIQNPILPSHHADPFIGYFAGKYWIYPTSEDTRSFRAFSSTNLVDWVDQGEIYNLSQSSWATNGYGWAPCMVYLNGNYYYYYAVGGVAGWQDSKIGVAVGASPSGPFTDIGSPLVASQTSSPHIEAIDPMVFIDTNGSAYLYYGGSGGANLGIRQLNTNTMTSFSGSLSVVTPSGFTEGAFMSKRNGIYYISYSNGNWQTNTYNVRYATSSSPMGPWTYKGQILTSDSLHEGPGSHSFLQISNTDTWYICYHYWDSVYSTRHVALDSLNYNADGTIRPVTMTGGGTVTKWESYSLPGYYIVHTNGVAKLVNSDWTDATSQFLMVPGLANKGANAVSFELIDKSDRYLRQNSSGQMVMDLWTVGGTFNADATFYMRPGLANITNTSFESYNYPSTYIRRSSSLVYRQSGSGSAFNSDATWKGWTASTLSNLQIASTSGNQATVTWSPTWNGAGTLLEAANLSGPWTTNSSAVSPFVATSTNSARFYRVKE